MTRHASILLLTAILLVFLSTYLLVIVFLLLETTQEIVEVARVQAVPRVAIRGRPLIFSHDPLATHEAATVYLSLELLVIIVLLLLSYGGTLLVLRSFRVVKFLLWHGDHDWPSVTMVVTRIHMRVAGLFHFFIGEVGHVIWVWIITKGADVTHFL